MPIKTRISGKTIRKRKSDFLSRTKNQKIGDLGEDFAQSTLNKAGGCFVCEHERGKVKKCGNSFAAVDLICEFCFQAYQVKTTAQKDTSSLPSSVRGAQYPPLLARKEHGIFHPLLIVLFKKGQGGPCNLVRTWRKTATIWYLSAQDVEKHFDELFIPYYTEIKSGKEKGRKLQMTTIKLGKSVREKFVELNSTTYIEPFLGGGALLFDFLSNRIPAGPFLKWAGGKTKLLPQIRTKLPKTTIPFHRTIKKFIAFDINPELVLCYNIVKHEVNSLIEELRKLEKNFPYWDREKDSGIPGERKEYYYAIRRDWNSKVGVILSKGEKIERAAQMIFLNRTCFNGLFRVNRDGGFNVPIGSYVNQTILFEDKLMNASKALRDVKIIHGSYLDCERYVDAKTFVYFDPPYRPLTTSSSFTTYTKSGFNDQNQKELAKFFSKLSTTGSKLMLSNSDPKNADENDEFFDRLYSKFNIQRVQTIHSINSDGEGRELINEIIVCNY